MCGHPIQEDQFSGRRGKNLVQVHELEVRWNDTSYQDFEFGKAKKKFDNSCV